ncbi:AAA family ATPase [Actinomycetota bacterium]
MSVRVLTALDPRWESDYAVLIDSSRDATVVRRCADVAELLSTAEAGLADVALVSATVPGLDRDAVDRLRHCGVHPCGALAGGDQADERRLRQLGVELWLPLTAGPGEVDDLLRSAVAARADDGDVARADDILVRAAGARGQTGQAAAGGVSGRADPAETAGDVGLPVGLHSDAVDDLPRRGSVLAVWGPTGAPGRTTVAVGLAAELAAAGVSVLLVDADTYGASVAQWLSLLDEAPGLAAAARSSEQGSLDLPTLARHAPEVAPRFRVLTGLPRADRWTEVRSAAMEQVLALARELAEVVVVDCGFGIEDDEELSYDTLAPRRNATTLTALEAADELVVVGAADPVGLQRLVRAVQSLDVLPCATPLVVVNRVRASAVGTRPEQRIGEALGRFAGLEEPVFLPYDLEAADGALLAGRTLVEHAPTSSLREALTALAARLDAYPASAAVPQGRRRRLTGSRRR